MMPNVCAPTTTSTIRIWRNNWQKPTSCKETSNKASMTKSMRKWRTPSVCFLPNWKILWSIPKPKFPGNPNTTMPRNVKLLIYVRILSSRKTKSSMNQATNLRWTTPLLSFWKILLSSSRNKTTLRPSSKPNRNELSWRTRKCKLSKKSLKTYKTDQATKKFSCLTIPNFRKS